MEVDERRLLRRLSAFAAAVSLAVSPAAPGSVGLPTKAEPVCPPGSDVGIEDFVAWVDSTGGSNADVPVRAAVPCAYTRTITFKTYDISAKSGEDYVGVEYGTITLTGGTNNTTVRIQILGKPVPGPDVTFGVRLTSGARFSDPEATITIKRR